MAKNKPYLAAVLAVCLLAACGQAKKEELITGKWKATSIENPELAKNLADQQTFIDTIGQHSSGMEAAQAYGYPSVDSMKHDMQRGLDQFKVRQQQVIARTVFEFRKDGVALLNFGTGADSAKWSFDEDGMLVLDEQQLNGVGGKLLMKVDTVSDGMLHLTYTEEGVTSTVKFIKEK